MAGPTRILHEGADFVAVEKPAGLFVHRTKLDGTQPGLIGRLRHELDRPLHSVHRLDRPVSGILLVAFDPAATARLQAALAQPDAIKEYVALVRGRTEPELTCDEPLRNDSGQLREARTELRTLRRFAWCSLVAVRIRTGRRHQIRRHCDRLRHHVLGDTTYGKGRLNKLYRERYGLARPFLHARRLVLPSEGLDVRSRLPDDLARLVVGLVRDHASQDGSVLFC
jgi:tRNA pseudouridine65 synthase